MLQFNSQTDMINYIRSLSKTANYDALLGEEFGIHSIPADADPFKKEFFFKYLVQGQYMGLKEADLYQYATRNVYGFEQKFPWVAHAEALQTPSNPAPAKAPAKYVDPKVAKRGQRTCKKHTGPDGSAKYIEHRGVWIGFWNGKCVVTRKTEEKVMEFFKTFNPAK